MLEHPWIAKSHKKMVEMRRKSSDEGDKMKQFMAYTSTDLQKIEKLYEDNDKKE